VQEAQIEGIGVGDENQSTHRATPLAPGSMLQHGTGATVSLFLRSLQSPCLQAWAE
jgi:hypothetical protein